MGEVVTAGVVLAAGAGSRLAPLTRLRPKALCPVALRPLLDRALDRVAPVTGEGPARIAVNAWHLADLLVEHVAESGGRADVRVEREPLGTAGAIGALRAWLDGRAVLVTNADTYLPEGRRLLALLTQGWDGRRCRLLCGPTPEGARTDFSTADGLAWDADGGRVGGGSRLRFLGASLLPAALAARLDASPSGLYEALWRGLAARGELEFVVTDAVFVDCGTPADYLWANLHASGGESVVGRGAVVEGLLTRSVVWDGAFVGRGEHLIETIRAGDRSTPVTVAVGGRRHKGDVS